MSCAFLPKMIYIKVIAAAGAFILYSAPLIAYAAAVGCRDAAAYAEQSLMLPIGLLKSIGFVETRNQPWSVNVDGVGHSFSSAHDAASFVRSASRLGGRYIDVGCFQIDLLYHPDAFISLESAFDPIENAMAAGRFLLSLNQDASSWFKAVGRFHSSLPSLSTSYAERVYAALNGTNPPARQPSIDSDNTAFGVKVVTPFRSVTLHKSIIYQAGLPTVQTP